MAQKLVTVAVTLRLDDDQPVQDWIIDAIQRNLEPHEEIVSYTDTEQESK